jgi:hypothetical protein
VFIDNGIYLQLLNEGHLGVTANWTKSGCGVCFSNIKVDYWDEILLKDHFRLGPDWDRYIWPDDVAIITTVGLGGGLYYDLGAFQEFMLYVKWNLPSYCVDCRQ